MSKRKKIIKFDSGLNSATKVTTSKGGLTGQAPPKFIPTANRSGPAGFRDGTIGIRG